MKNNKTNVSLDTETTVSLDSEVFQLKSQLDFNIIKNLYEKNGWGWYQLNNPNTYINECRVMSSGKSSLRTTLFHTIQSYGYSKRIDGKDYRRDDSVTLKIAGEKSYIEYKDKEKMIARNEIVKFLKSNPNDHKYKRIDVPFDIELKGDDKEKFDIDNFFFIQISKGVNTNSPFDYYVNENDGSKTYYSKKGDRLSKQTLMYLKHIKENLDDRFILRLESAYLKLINFGDDPEKIIKYIENDIKTKRLFFFDDVDDCTHFKEQYRNNILKDESPNVPDRLLRDIKSKSTKEFDLVLSDEIKDHIRNVLTKDKELKEVESSPAAMALRGTMGKKGIRKKG